MNSLGIVLSSVSSQLKVSRDGSTDSGSDLNVIPGDWVYVKDLQSKT